MSFGVRVFDTVLDGKKLKDSVSRNAAFFWREFCNASNWSFSYERVHSLEDLSYFLGRTIKENIIIFSGHGERDGWHLTNNETLNETSVNAVNFHGNNFGKDIIFSACLMSKNGNLCSSIKEKFEARRLFAYRHVMQDRFCFLNEAVLLTLIHKNKNFTKGDFEKFKAKTEFMKTMNKKHAKCHPMEMY